MDTEKKAAADDIQTISQEEAERARLAIEYKYELDNRDKKALAKKESRAEAEERIRREKIDSVRKMKEAGLSTGQIKNLTGLSAEEIENF